MADLASHAQTFELQAKEGLEADKYEIIHCQICK